MRAVAQRVSSAKVVVDGSTVGEIGIGMLLLVGVARGDDEDDAVALADKVAGLRIFPDHEGKMNRSLADTGGEVLVVSQFTLLGDVRRGRRPSFTEAAAPEEAAPLLDSVTRRIGEHGIVVRTGVFGAHMEIALVNDGPVTLLLEVSRGSVA